MAEHRVDVRVTTRCGDVWLGCVCGWVSPPLRGSALAEAAYFLHALDEPEIGDGTNPYLTFFQ